MESNKVFSNLLDGKLMDIKPRYKRSVFLFRRDLRFIDNNGLNKASRESEHVVPVFIFDERQINPMKNDYFCHASVQVMIESLQELDKSLQEISSRMFYFHGSYPEILVQMLDEINPDAVFVNEDYTPFSIKRDAEIKKYCGLKGIQFVSCSDIMLVEKGKILKKNGRFYEEYTPYYLRVSKMEIARPVTECPLNFIHKTQVFKSEFKDSIHGFYIRNENVFLKGGRTVSLEILSRIPEFKDYAKIRGFADKNTTQLSPYIKYGTVSIREVYWRVYDTLGPQHDLLRQLFWRDFYYNILYFFPDAIYDSYSPQFRGIEWPHNEKWFEAWRQGQTGFPLVDAAMRAMRTHFWIPNSLRLVVSTFMVKVLLIDWRHGQRVFAQELVDYDLALNNGGWQWAASTGAVCQPYNIIFNPMLQCETMDKDCEFVLKWCPELKDVPHKHIHYWPHFYKQYPEVNYPEPIVNFEERKEVVLKWFQIMYNRDVGAEKKIQNSIPMDCPEDKVLKEDMFEEEDESLSMNIEDF